MASQPLISEENEPQDLKRFYSWASNHKEYSQSTADIYRTATRRWAKWCEENDKPLLEPQPQDVEDFFIDMRDSGLAEKTLSSTRAGLSVFLRKRGPWEDPKPGQTGTYSDQTPADKADIGSWGAKSVKSQEERGVHYLEEEQIEQLLNNVPPRHTIRNKLLLRMMLQTGCRASEIATIRCGYNPDWENNELRDINREECTIEVKDKKSGGYRTVVYQDGLNSLLRLWIEAERDGMYQASESQYLFLTNKDEHIHPQAVNRIVRQSAENAGINRTYMTNSEGHERASITSHVLRHTFAMHALREGLDTKWIKEQLGHSDISTTIEMYLHEDKETMKREIKTHGPTF